LTLPSRTLAPDFRLPLILQRAVATDVGLRLRDGGSVITPSSASVSVYRDTGATDLVQTAVATPGDTSIASLSATSSTESLSAEWVAAWTWVASGVTYTDRQRVILVGQVPRPRVACEDVYGGDGVPELRHPARLPSGQTDWSPQVSAAWDEVLRTLTARGKRPWLTVDDTDLYAWHLALSVHHACAAVPSAQGEYFHGLTSEWRKRADAAYHDLTIEYEDAPQIRKAAGRTLYAAAPRRPLW
jgi:hypothetical protein